MSYNEGIHQPDPWLEREAQRLKQEKGVQREATIFGWVFVGVAAAILTIGLIWRRRNKSRAKQRR